MTVPSALDAVTFGEVMAMFVAEEPGPLEHVVRFRRALAGAECNVATGLAHSVGRRFGSNEMVAPAARATSTARNAKSRALADRASGMPVTCRCRAAAT